MGRGLTNIPNAFSGSCLHVAGCRLLDMGSRSGAAPISNFMRRLRLSCAVLCCISVCVQRDITMDTAMHTHLPAFRYARPLNIAAHTPLPIHNTARGDRVCARRAAQRSRLMRRLRNEFCEGHAALQYRNSDVRKRTVEF